MPNPLDKYRSGTVSESLPRSKGHGTRCDICLGAKRVSNQPYTTAEMDAKLDKANNTKAEENHRSWWMPIVENYEDDRNGEPPRHASALPASREGPLTVVSAHHDESIERKAKQYHFWPNDVYVKHFGSKPVEEDIESDFDENGDLCSGVKRNPSDDPSPLPRGVVEVFKTSKVGADRRRELDRSDKHIDDGQGERAWTKARLKTRAVVTEESVKTEGDDEARTVLRCAGATAAKANDSDDDDDDSDDFACFAVKKAFNIKNTPADPAKHGKWPSRT